MKTKQDLLDRMEKLNACGEATDWVKASEKRTAEAIWAECPRGDWLLWLAGRCEVDRKALVRAACLCARTVLHLMPNGEKRPQQAIEMAEMWIEDRATIDEVRTASYASYAAYAAYAANAAAAYAAAAYAAANAANAATNAAAATDASYAAANAANAATNAAAATYAAAADARKRNQQQTADLVRSVIKWEDLR